MKQRIEIDLQGKEESDIEFALEEVVRLIRAGFTSGANRNESGSFSFSIAQKP